MLAKASPGRSDSGAIEITEQVSRDTIQRSTPNWAGFLRQCWRFPWLVGEIGFAGARYPWRMARTAKQKRREARAAWLGASSRRVLRALGIAVEVKEGRIPVRGLLVANHLSYLDIMVIASVARVRFVSKSEVAGWPVFGTLAKWAGTIFVKRERRSDSSRVVTELDAALREGELVVLFPEGTSSGGETVLPFKSSLLEPVAGEEHPIAVAFLSYHMPRGSVRDEVCYWGDMTLGPHLLNLLRRSGIRARLVFGSVQESPSDRKALARHLHGEVLRLQGNSGSVAAFASASI